jgi:hypothetical protein
MCEIFYLLFFFTLISLIWVGDSGTEKILIGNLRPIFINLYLKRKRSVRKKLKAHTQPVLQNFKHTLKKCILSEHAHKNVSAHAECVTF